MLALQRRRHRKTKLENRRGGVAERLNAPVLKTGMPATVSRVRIPPPPPIACPTLPRTFPHILYSELTRRR